MIVGQAKFLYDELNTALVKVKEISVLYLMLSFDNLEELLTPLHLFVGCRLLSLPCFMVDKDDEEFSVPDDILRKRAKYLHM